MTNLHRRPFIIAMKGAPNGAIVVPKLGHLLAALEEKDTPKFDY